MREEVGVSLEIDSMVSWDRDDGQTIVVVNDTKRGAAILRAVTPAIADKERRRKWSAALADADGWLQLARKDAKRRDYEASRQAVDCVIRALEKAMLYREPEE